MLSLSLFIINITFLLLLTFIVYLLISRSHFDCIGSLSFGKNPMTQERTIFIFLTLMRMSRLREVKVPSKGHTANERLQGLQRSQCNFRTFEDMLA